MAKNHSIAQAKYDSTHCKYYSFKMHLVNDADIITKLSEVDSMQGYVKQLIRDDITKPVPVSRTDSVQISENTMSLLKDKAEKADISVPVLVNLIVNEWILHNMDK